jgi:hypothetical protein
MPKFSDRIFGSSLSEETKEILNKLQDGSFEVTPLDSVDDNNRHYLGNQTTFARMWTTFLISGSVTQQVGYHVVNQNNQDDYVQALEPVTGNIADKDEQLRINGLRNNPLLKPNSGITSVTSRTMGSLGSVRSTTINFKVFNKKDFDEIYLPYFLRPGATVIVDFGWSYDNVEFYDLDEYLFNTDIQLEFLLSSIYGGLQKVDNKFDVYLDNGKYYYNDDDGNRVETVNPKVDGYKNKKINKGKVDTHVGLVYDYTAKLNQQGHYECTVQMYSRGTVLLDTEINEDNDLKHIFTTKFEEILLDSVSEINRLRREEGGATAELGISNAQWQIYDFLSAEGQRDVLESLYDAIEVSKQSVGTMSSRNLSSGIYYQDYTPYTTQGNNLDVGYISYGLFEDLFLNGIVAESRKVNSIYAVEFNTKDTMIRYSDALVARQVQFLSSGEDLSLFLYPYMGKSGKSLSEMLGRFSRNSKETFGDVDKKDRIKIYQKMLDGNHDEYQNKKVIPLRDLFISVKLITESFQKLKTVNDAFVNILEQINKDSYDVFQLKLKALNDTFSAMTVQDVNLLPEAPKDDSIFMFDITSGNSIVNDLDFSFAMPKGNLGNMIAIGQKPRGKFFDDDRKDDFSFLQATGPEGKKLYGENVSVLSLPLVKEDIEKKESIEANRDLVKEKTLRNNFKDTKIETGQQTMTEVFNQAVTQAAINNKLTTVSTDIQKEKEIQQFNNLSSIKEFKENNKIIGGTSLRDMYGKIAKINVRFGDKDKKDAIYNLIPAELTISVYGNSYLQIGDLFSFNFLPKWMTEKMIFIVKGIEDTIDTRWVTRYTMQPFIRPEVKGEFINVSDFEPALGRETIIKDIQSGGNGVGGGDINDGFKKLVVKGKEVQIDGNVTVFSVTTIYNEETKQFVADNEKFKNFLERGFSTPDTIVSDISSVSSVSDLQFVFSLNYALKKLLLKSLESQGLVSADTENNFCKIDLLSDTIPTQFVKSFSGDSSLRSFFAGIVEVRDGWFNTEGDDNALITYLQNVFKKVQLNIKEGDYTGTYYQDDSSLKYKSEEITVDSLKSFAEGFGGLQNNAEFFNKFIENTQNLPTGYIINGVKSGNFFLSGQELVKDIISDYNVLFTSFGFKTFFSSKQTGVAESFLITFHRPISENIQTIVIPKWVFDRSGVSLQTFVNDVEYFFDNNKYIRKFTTSNKAPAISSPFQGEDAGFIG